MTKKAAQLVVVFAILAVVGVVCAMAIYNSLLGPVSKDDTKKQFEVKEGATGNQIATDLKEAGLIKSSLAFRIYASNQHIASKFAQGVYYLAPNMGSKTIADELVKGEKIDIRITSIEGWRNEEIAQELENKMQIPQADFLKGAKQGYMFPDTYFFNKKETVSDIAQTMEANFDKRITQDIQQKILAKKLTLDQGITLASIVERESHESVPNERQIIASILHKRYKMGMALQADATVQYALGYDKLQKKWWRVLSVDELKTKSPYNTYVNPGLPPGPICNPGLEAIQAVADITDTPYLFYIHGKDGVAHFARTLEEHDLNRQKYL